MMARPLLVTDTVGFIRDLPAWLVDAFHSTLEEIALADVVLLTIDVSEPLDEIASKLAVCQKELVHLQVTVPVVTALNKSDLLSADELKKRLGDLERLRLIDPTRALPISASLKTNLGRLVALIHDQLPPSRHLVVELPNDGQGASVLSELHALMRIESTHYGETLRVEGVTDPLHFPSIVSTVKKNRGKVRVVP
jgi:GTP-binding protein HflX